MEVIIKVPEPLCMEAAQASSVQKCVLKPYRRPVEAAQAPTAHFLHLKPLRRPVHSFMFLESADHACGILLKLITIESALGGWAGTWFDTWALHRVDGGLVALFVDIEANLFWIAESKTYRIELVWRREV